jgi:hypothetical protein
MDVHKKIDKMILAINGKDTAIKKLRDLLVELQKNQAVKWMKK